MMIVLKVLTQKLRKSMHLEYAGTYIHQQSQLKNPFIEAVFLPSHGHNGTPKFDEIFKKHRDESQKTKLKK